MHEGEYAAYSALSGPSATLPLLSRVNVGSERTLSRRYEVDELPALVLAWSSRWTAYTGPHRSESMVEFAEAHASPLVEVLASDAQLAPLLEQQRRSGAEEVPGRVLLLGFFGDLDEEDEELDDLRQATRHLRQQRTDVAVRAVALRTSRALNDEYSRRRRWFSRTPSALVLVDGSPSGGAFRLDERDDDGLDFGAWAARAAVPELGELTGATFKAYAATDLPMLIAFVRPGVDNRPLKRELRGVARRFRGKLATVWCDGEQHGARMLSLGLHSDVLPQVAFNTKDGRKLPYGTGLPLTEAALSRFAADFLGERLRPMPPPEPLPPTVGRGGANAGAVVELGEDTVDAVAMDVQHDVLLQLYTRRGCDPCEQMEVYYDKVAQRFAELRVATVVVARVDVVRIKLPEALRTIQLNSLPTVLALPARNKEPPFALYNGQARPKEMMYFLQRHATHSFELPPNPHLTREQHAMWKQQVADLPSEKVKAAYESLERETGLARDEL